MALWEFTQFDDEEVEVDEKEFFLRGKDGLILLIDCTTSMFEPLYSDSDERPFDLSVKCAQTVMKNKILAGNKDLIAVVFFGTDKSKNPSEFKNIYVLQELDQPGASQVLKIESMIDISNQKFEEDYGNNSSFSLSDAMWTCSIMFSNCKQKLSHKRILLFTCNDDPHSSNMVLQNQSRKKASDLFDVGIEIYLMNIQRSGVNFDYSKFYKDVIQLPADEDSKEFPNASEKFEELLTRVRRKDSKKRPLANIQLHLGGDVNFCVSVYCLVKVQHKPYPVKLFKANNEEVKSFKKNYNAQTGEVPLPTDIKFNQKHGNRNISFEKDELVEMKQIGSNGITLLGFKPTSALKIYHHTKPCRFIYPNEKDIKGSTKIFFAFLQKCLDRKVMAICWYSSSQHSKPCLVALYPQAEVLDDNKVQIEPPGFHVIYLPYTDNIRPLAVEQVESSSGLIANEEQIDKAKEIIKKLQFGFNSEAFDNPVLQTHFRNIEALALNEDDLEDIIDYTLPDDEIIKKRAGSLFDEFKEMVFPDGSLCSVPAKRKPAGGNTKAVMEIDIKAEAAAGRLGKLTVPVLKSFARSSNITCGSRKAELVEAILHHFDLDG